MSLRQTPTPASIRPLTLAFLAAYLAVHAATMQAGGTNPRSRWLTLQSMVSIVVLGLVLKVSSYLPWLK